MPRPQPDSPVTEREREREREREKRHHTNAHPVHVDAEERNVLAERQQVQGVVLEDVLLWPKVD
jgi:hypothetical protein